MLQWVFLVLFLTVVTIGWVVFSLLSSGSITTNIRLSRKYPVVWPAPRKMSQGDPVKLSGLVLKSRCPLLKHRFFQLGFPRGSSVVINIIEEGSCNFQPHLDFGIDESYSINYDGHEIDIKAPTVYGAMYALTTLRQLVRSDDTGHWIPSTIQVKDQPAFPHRGLMIDTGRVYLPKYLIKKTIDSMAFVKLNVLHWHLVDAQNFPYVPPSHPELAQGSTGKTYSQKDVKNIVEYANARGIRVVMEIDTPAHAYSWSVSHPDLVTCFDSSSQNHASCPEPPCGALDITHKIKLPDIHSLVQDVWKDAMETTQDSFVHIGGDELKKKCSVHPETLQKDFEAYVNTLATFMKSQGKTVVLWEDILNPYLTSSTPPNLSKNVVIETWLGDHVPHIADKLNYKVIATGTFWYLDVGRNTFFLDAPSWASFSAWQYMYNRDILAGVQNTENVLGGEVCAWGETIDEMNLASLTWPRASAVAEILWTNPPLNKNAQGVMTRLQHSDNSRTDVWRRFQHHREDLLELGTRASPVAPPFCVHSDLCADYANDKSRNKAHWPVTPFSAPTLMSYCTESDPCIGDITSQGVKKTNAAGNCPTNSASISGQCIKTVDPGKMCPANTMPVQQLGDDWGGKLVCMGASITGTVSSGQLLPGLGVQQNKAQGQLPAVACYDTNGWLLYNNI